MNPCRPVSTGPLGTLLACAIGAAGVVAAASTHGQDMPYVDAVGAYHHANVMTPPREAGKDTSERRGDPRRIAHAAAAGADAGGAIPRAKFDAIVSDLRLEYHERVTRDGKVSADAWLERSVGALKRRHTTIED